MNLPLFKIHIEISNEFHQSRYKCLNSTKNYLFRIHAVRRFNLSGCSSHLCWGVGNGTAVRALAFHHCGLGSITPGLGVTCVG